MKERDIDEIIINVLNGMASREEREVLNKWLERSDHNLQQFEYLKLIWNERSAKPKVPNAQQMADKIWEKATGEYVLRTYPRCNKTGWKRYLGIAALITILLAASIMFLKDSDFRNQKVYSNRIIEKSTQAGQKLRVTLPDSSIVWINSESSIRYSENFAPESRIIELRGEAYFDVKKDEERSFEVMAGDLTIEALGTSFNVNAFNSREEIKVALVEGKVGIANNEALTMLLNPGELAVYNAAQKVFKKGRSSLEGETSWKDGRIVFKNADFDTVIERLERWYGVEFRYDEEKKPDWDFTANFTNSNLENVLKVIGFGEGFQFEIERSIVTLYF